MPYMTLVGADFLFIQDNMYPQVARWMFKFLEEVEIAQFEWLTCSTSGIGWVDASEFILLW